ncbi:MAG: hypothetical protein GWQ05_17970, partial [Verrucomicrobiaceae bacterium]|nr:hypothetical protein [Verrucomicrobiaceae bacterium]
YRNKRELRVFSPYCRDYVDLAILHSGGSANVLHNIGDGLPYIPREMRRYPMFNKVRPLCEGHDGVGGKKLCQPDNRVEPMILMLNRKRHYGLVSTVPENDIPWEDKIGKAVWRGQYSKPHETISGTADVKYALVSNHLNSTLVDAMFSKHTEGASSDMVGSYMGVKEQLAHKYIISIEGNDVSSGLKWMLFSNSVVMAPPFAWESWAMEGKLVPFRHYIPLKADMSDVEDMILWAEAHPEEARLISERSTLFIYDLLFHPDAVGDEKEIMIQMMERFEWNFGSNDATNELDALDMHSDEQSLDEALRFPSIEERVKHSMGKWYYNVNSTSMKRSHSPNLPGILTHRISKEEIFIASGRELSACAMANSPYSENIRAFCQNSLPDFDERITADLKSNSFNRLLKTAKGESMKLASQSSWRHDGKGMKESKRVLLDDSVKLLCYGSCQQRVGFPYFARNRAKRNGDAIIWPFSETDSVNHEVKLRVLERYMNLWLGLEPKAPVFHNFSPFLSRHSLCEIFCASVNFTHQTPARAGHSAPFFWS